MNRRKFLQNGAMAVVAASVAPAAVLLGNDLISAFDDLYARRIGFATGGVVPSGTLFVGEHACDHFIPNATMERIKELMLTPDYYSRPLISSEWYLKRQA